jgi:hypothetical protein
MQWAGAPACNTTSASPWCIVIEQTYCAIIRQPAMPSIVRNDEFGTPRVRRLLRLVPTLADSEPGDHGNGEAEIDESHCYYSLESSLVPVVGLEPIWTVLREWPETLSSIDTIVDIDDLAFYIRCNKMNGNTVLLSGKFRKHRRCHRYWRGLSQGDHSSAQYRALEGMMWRMPPRGSGTSPV